MDARPTLFALAWVLNEEGLEAVMIGMRPPHCMERL
jgi:aryl-alcohol dehydrogenase-like predicted oxidoreductase